MFRFIRGKMGPKINFKSEVEVKDLCDIESSFAFIYENERWVYLFGELKLRDRDFDEIEENLGIEFLKKIILLNFFEFI